MTTEDDDRSDFFAMGKGGSLLFVGAVLSTVFSFLTRLLVANEFDVVRYGQFSIFFSIVTIFGFVGTMGLRDGVTRFIGHYRGVSNDAAQSSIIRWGLIFATVGGLAVGLVLFIVSGPFASLLSGDDEFVFAIRMAAFTIPFLALLLFIPSIFMGYERAEEQTLYQNLLRNILFLVLLMVVVATNLPYSWTYVVFFVATSASLGLMGIRLYRARGTIISDMKGDLERKYGKELLLFSLPLVLQILANEVMSWSDSIILGVFLADADVGLYNAAKPLAAMNNIFYVNFMVLFIPIATRLNASGKKEQVKKIYKSITKWTVLITYPLFVVLLVFPRQALSTLFGPEYMDAAFSLQLLSLGFFVVNMYGPTSHGLIVNNRSKTLVSITGLSAIFNVIFSTLCIISFGFIGAAMGIILTLVVSNLIKVIILHRISGLHPYSRDNMVLNLGGGGLLIFTSLALNVVFDIGFIHLPFIFFGLFFILLIFMFLARAVDDDDVHMFQDMERMLGIDLKRTKRFLNRLYVR